MDLHLKQWRNKHEHSAKMPKFLLEEQPHHHQQPQSSAAALPLFVPEPNTNSKVSTLSAFSDSTLPTPRLPSSMGSCFSLAQWQELELQALIFRYMLAGTAVPPELLQLIKKNLILHSSPYFLHHPLQQYYPHYQSPLLQSGYWGRAAMDPEPGRCRRTDGKKWRCSRDVVAGQKYCERHVHRGRNRSRKPVELPTPNVAGGGESLRATTSNSAPPLATSSLQSPIYLLNLNQSSSRTKNENNGLFGNKDNAGGDGRSGGHMLRHFFNGWPQSVQEPDSNVESNADSMNSATCLSISMPGNTSSDVSLKLSTGNGEDTYHRNGNAEAGQTHLNWAGGWNSSNLVSSMGGPLAEALRSSNSTLSPTSVLHQLPRSIASETSFISTYI